MTDRSNIDYDISKQAVAAANLVKSLGDMGDDEELLHDVVEGETGLFEAVEFALDEISECEIIQSGCADMIKKLSDRSVRAKDRANRLRGLIDQAFQLAEVKSHKFPTATISTKSVPPKLIITDEASIPAEFFVPQPPKLDKSALAKAAKERAITGAEMSNGGTTIQIRRG